jgi:[ribosomal protein S18]-alanine N-acetyltransferase
MNALTVRRLEPRDLEAVITLEDVALPWATSWTPDSYLPAPESGMAAWVAERAGSIAGFALARYVGGEMELLNLAVAETARRMGVGRALVRATLDEGAARGARQAFLEVRDSNTGARAFYETLGFTQVGRRKAYYQAPVEDALILSIPLPHGA